MNYNIENKVEPEQYIDRIGSRFFVDISLSGCGNGCSYCYVESKNEPQRLLDIAQVKSMCEIIGSYKSDSPGIITLCPNTEPLKSADSIERVLYIVRYFLSRGYYIQISTKEHIPESFLREINELSEGRVFINISIPYIANTDVIEPGAASVNDRIRNFISLKNYKSLIPCLYIKPFNDIAAKYMDDYIALINAYDIRLVCVGVRFNQDDTTPCRSLYKKCVAEDLFAAQHDSIDKFVTELRNRTKAKVFGSSVCCICNTHRVSCMLDLSNYDKAICADCIYN